ncbi:MAG: hypothetical protein ACE5KZ_02370 [Candidatus Scalinduaceae bacterium]
MSTKKDGNSLCSVCSQNGESIASLNIKEWETNFFKRKFGILNINHHVLVNMNIEEIHYTLDSLLSFADKNSFRLVELQLNAYGLEFVPLLEDKGFRLVDTRTTFITLMKRSTLKANLCEVGDIGFASRDDLEEILILTHKSFTNNHLFYSRFKNKKYFTKEESERYYTTWIENHIEDKKSFFCVLKKDQKVIGYSILKDAGHKNGEKLYKAILSTVDSNYRGRNIYLLIQSFLCNNLQEDQFYLDNTTQLTNFAMIRNHIKAQKGLDSISLIFYRTEIEIS